MFEALKYFSSCKKRDSKIDAIAIANIIIIRDFFFEKSLRAQQKNLHDTNYARVHDEEATQNSLTKSKTHFIISPPTATRQPLQKRKSSTFTTNRQFTYR